MNDLLISVEWLIGKLNLHIIMIKGSKIFTYRVDDIYNKNELDIVLSAIMKNDFQELVNIVKKKYDLEHMTIRFSYGPTLRKKIKEWRKINK